VTDQGLIRSCAVCRGCKQHLQPMPKGAISCC
jgi:hypothetical protein